MPAPPHRVSIPGLDVAYHQAGTGDPVILLHGFPQTSHEWRHQVPALADAGYAVFAPDTRGFGATDKPDVRVSRALLARDVVDFADALGIERFHLVGHDWGGIIAAKVAFDHPDRIDRLALLDTIASVWAPRAIHGWWFKSEGRAEEYFAAHHRTMIEGFFGGRDGADLPGPPVAPWIAPERRALAARSGSTRTTSTTTWRRSRTRRAGRRPSSTTATACPSTAGSTAGRSRCRSGRSAEQWEHPGGLAEHPEHPWFPSFGPEDHDRPFGGPVLWLHGSYGGRGGGERGDARIPAGNPFVDQFRHHYPDLRARAAGCGHFIPEEAPQFTNETLVAFLGGGL